LFARCLLEGFNEILALAGDPAPRAVPASFEAEPADAPTRSEAGS
jgi:diacylglycerol O-acyltransferase / wax synthase